MGGKTKLIGVAAGVALLFVAIVRPATGQSMRLRAQRIADAGSPTFVTHAPGDEARLFFTERAGQVRIIKNGNLLDEPFLDLSDRADASSEGGLLSLAFSRDYARDGAFFVFYSAQDPVHALYIDRCMVSDNPDSANPLCTRLLVLQRSIFDLHKGGWIGCGPDGHLYAAIGDGTDGLAAQDIGVLSGKILRLGVGGDDFPADDMRNYTIPADNPFVKRDGADEVWAYGLRNPWRASFDRGTGDFFIGDVGLQAWEEVNFQPAGDRGAPNYGWPCFEGPDCQDACKCKTATHTTPLHFYGNIPNQASAIIGGYVYRGPTIPWLQGRYLFADLAGMVWSLGLDAGAVVDVADHSEELLMGSIHSLGEDSDGELYLCAWPPLGAAGIFRIIPAPAEHILSSDPPDGSVDARAAVDARGKPLASWAQLDLDFDGDVGQLSAEMFFTHQAGGFDQTPQVTSVHPLANDRLRVQLSAAVAPGTRLVIGLQESGSAVCLGHLPGDVDADGLSSPLDILALIDGLNGAADPALQAWQCDIDRSEQCAPQDILRLIDVLNGAGGQTRWLHAELPECP